jgi:hypothetical protein
LPRCLLDSAVIDKALGVTSPSQAASWIHTDKERTLKASTFRILSDCVQWPQPLRSRWFVCTAIAAAMMTLTCGTTTKNPGPLKRLDPKTEKDNSEPVTNTESKPELSNPLDPESALVVEIPRTRMKPFCEDLSQRNHC